MAIKILGLDLGVASIGWGVIEAERDEKKLKNVSVLGLGVREIPLDTDEKKEFSSGNAATKTQNRTLKRSARKRYMRYRLRRTYLLKVLVEKGMMPENFAQNPKDYLPETLYLLREKALSEQITLQDLGRILYHLNQKRGFKSSRKDFSKDTETDYKKQITENEKLLQTLGYTIGQFCALELKKQRILQADIQAGKKSVADLSEAEKETLYFQVKKRIFNRSTYIAEFNQIFEKQRNYYPNVLTQDLQIEIRDRIIYYQRDLKSCKGLVGFCELEPLCNMQDKKTGKEIRVGVKVAPVSAPLAEFCALWERINALCAKIKDIDKKIVPITLAEKQKMFAHFTKSENLSCTQFLKILGRSGDEIIINEHLQKYGIKGMANYHLLYKTLQELNLDTEKYMRFNLQMQAESVSKDGEIIPIQIDNNYQNEPLYQLWHDLYALSDEPLLKKLQEKYGFSSEQAQRLNQVTFKQDFSNKSIKAMRKLLPHLMQGVVYSDAAELAGFNHSKSETLAEKAIRDLLPSLPLLKKNSLRQPVVEKILNHLVNLVNDVINPANGLVSQEERESGNFEIRIELARDLNKSIKERKRLTLSISANEKENKRIVDVLKPMKMGQNISRNDINRYKLWEQQGGQCLYSGKSIELNKILSQAEVDRDHILPESLFPDDTLTNTCLVYAKENRDKGQRTAWDYIVATKTKDEQEKYLARVKKLLDLGSAKKQKKEENEAGAKGISPRKYDFLRMTLAEMPTDFATRQLNETRYISRKAGEMLRQVCREVRFSSGSITDMLKHSWGWHTILEELNVEKYAQHAPERIYEKEVNGRKRRCIKDWTKRDDHRHHAIDALVVACTTTQIIHALNNPKNLDEVKILQEEKKQETQKTSKIDYFLRYVCPLSHASVKQEVEKILVSCHKSNKVATKNLNRYKWLAKKEHTQKTLTPRKNLHKESVYGEVQTFAWKTVELKKINLENLQHVEAKYKKLLQTHLEKHQNDPKKAWKQDFLLPSGLALEKVRIKDWQKDYVLKYPLESLTPKDVESIVDAKIKHLVAERFRTCADTKKAFEQPLYVDKAQTIAIKTVRCKAVKNAVALHQNAKGKAIDFVQTRGNHHIAIYQDEQGKLQEVCLTFFDAMRRVKYGLPVFVSNTEYAMQKLLDTLPHIASEEQEIIIHTFPKANWQFVVSLSINEMFVHLPKQEVEELLAVRDYAKISAHLYRVQKLGEGDYTLRHHLETSLDNDFAKIRTGVKGLLNFTKVKINRLGQMKIWQ
jgi:CRISPR-associated endonuclease Csn1